MYVKNETLYSEADYRLEMLNTIRREKFDFVLPDAMREGDIDMWIHVIRRGSNDPFTVDFGTDNGFCVFFNNQSDSVERRLFGANFAMIADENIYDSIEDLDSLKDYVRACDPRRIGINMSDEATHFDSLSATDYRRLPKLIGDEYMERLTSAFKTVTYFRGRRLVSEIAFYGALLDMQRRIMLKGLNNIIPGKTTRREIALYGHAELLANGFEPNALKAVPPNIMYSEVSNQDEVDSLDYILQKGDFLFWDWGYERINLNYGLDFKRSIYLLKDGEKGLPKGVKDAWSWVMIAKDILRKTVVSGKTAGEIIDNLEKAFEAAGFVHTPFENQPEEIVDLLGDSETPGISIDFHTVGNVGTCYEVGTSIAPQRGHMHDRIVLDNQFIAFEFMVNFYVPEWKKRVLFDYEDNALITAAGCQFMSVPNEGILLGK